MLRLLQAPKAPPLSCHSPLVPVCREQKPDFILCACSFLPGEGSRAISFWGLCRIRHIVPVPLVSLLCHGQPEGGGVYLSAGFGRLTHSNIAEQSCSHRGPGSRGGVCWHCAGFSQPPCIPHRPPWDGIPPPQIFLWKCTYRHTQRRASVSRVILTPVQLTVTVTTTHTKESLTGRERSLLASEIT